MSLSSKRLKKEVEELKNSPKEGITLNSVNDDLYCWNASIKGPEGSPYENGEFHLDIDIPEDYPFEAPRLLFKTNIKHLNFSDHGEIVCNFLGDNWTPHESLTKALQKLRELMIKPDVQNPSDKQLLELHKSSPGDYDRDIREWTKKYAMNQS